MKKRYFIFLLCGILATGFTACSGKNKTTTSEKVSVTSASEIREVESSESTSVQTTVSSSSEKIKLTESDLADVITGLGDKEIVQDTENINYLHNTLYDSDFINGITVDSSRVDVSTPGTYDITYHIDVNTEALASYLSGSIKNQAEKNTTAKIIDINKTVTVLSPEDAAREADNGIIVYGADNKPTAKSDGTEVEDPAPLSPKSCTTRQTDPINAETGETYKPEEQAEESDSSGNTSDLEKESEKKEGNNSRTANNKADKTTTENNTSKSTSATKTNTNQSQKKDTGSKTSSSDKNSTQSEKSNTTPTKKKVWVVDHAAYDEAVYETVHHDAVTHEEPVYGTIPKIICNTCGAAFDNADQLVAHQSEVKGYDEDGFPIVDSGYHIVYEQVQTGTTTVVDQAAYDEQVQTGTVHHNEIGHWEYQ